MTDLCPARLTRLVALSLTAVGILTMTAGCAASSNERAKEPSAARYRSALNAVCTAATSARAGDLTAARQAFYDTAHQALHQLAADAARTDRPVAARLLEAKQAVESRFSSPAVPADLAPHLNALTVAASAAITTATGTQPEPCAERS